VRIEIENVDLSAYTIEEITQKIRSLFPKCVGVSYSPIERSLTLEFSEEEFENVIETKIKDVIAKIKKEHPNLKLRRAVLKELIEWVL